MSVSDFIFFLETYIYIIYCVHIILSFFLALFLSILTRKRFVVGGKEIEIRDKKRLEEISERSLLFRLLFKISLHKNNNITNFLFMFLFIFAMPVIGYIAAIWIALYLRSTSYEKRVSNTSILNLDEFEMSFLKVERIFGEGSMSELMNSTHASKSKKLKALSSLSNSLSPANLKIIRSTLSSTDDEIRMFGYATINKAETALNIKINHYLEIFNGVDDKKEYDKSQVANAAKELADLYWEMVYTELSHESLKVGFLNEVKSYIEIAKEYYISLSRSLQEELNQFDKKKELIEGSQSEEEKKELSEEEIEKNYLKRKEIKSNLLNSNNILTKLFLLKGKVYMHEKNYEQASTEFTIAQEFYEGESSFILPYLAEIQFILGNYTIVHSILNKSQDLGLNATLHPIVEQWKSS